MKKELENLQDAVNSINITEAMQMEIIQKRHKEKKTSFFQCGSGSCDSCHLVRCA